jgi:hypothetical protein
LFYEKLEISTSLVIHCPCFPPQEINIREKTKWHLRMENLETQATLGTRHGKFDH